MINRWKIEREDTLTATVQKLNQKVHAITRAPREFCRTGHCAQPSIYQLATAVDPVTAAGGAAAAATGPGAAGAAAAAGKNKSSSLHWIKLSLAITSRQQQQESKPQPCARGLLGTRDIVCDIGKLNDPIS